MKVVVSGLVNTETTVKVDQFPILYSPVQYPFFGIQTQVSGVGYNLAKALSTLGDTVHFFSFLGKDDAGDRVLRQLRQDRILAKQISRTLQQTPQSVILVDKEGKRQAYSDMKDIQEKQLDTVTEGMSECLYRAKIVVLCNVNFNRPMLMKMKKMKKTVATDVHVLSNLHDDYNEDFMRNADILFLSDECLPCPPEAFLLDLKNTYPSQVIVIGLGSKGAMLYERCTDRRYYLEAVPCDRVVNTIGAGDALFSSFLHFYGNGFSAVEALMRAEIFASNKIRYHGGSLGFSREMVIEEEFPVRKPAVQEIQ